ncbi:MAG TPA: copper resistance protein B [Allosphingosinicella sp.]
MAGGAAVLGGFGRGTGRLTLRLATAAAALALAAPVAAQRLDYADLGRAPAANPRLGYEAVADEELAGRGPAASSAPAERTAAAVSDLYLDQMEYVAGQGADGYAWDISGKVGGPIHRVYLASIGEGTFGGSLDYLEMQAFYSRRVSDMWDFQAGLRYDIRPLPNRAWLTLGMQGSTDALNLGAYAFLSQRGELAARLYGLWDIPLPGRFVLQPSAELNLFGEDIPELGLGRGLSYGEAGLRLRYVVHEDRFTPYVGVEYARSFGRTAHLAREAGEDHSGFVFLVGLRSWFD